VSGIVDAAKRGPRGALARKYALFVGFAISLALGINGIVGTIFAFSDQRALVARVQQEQAQAAAQRIGGFVGDIVRQLDWVSLNSSDALALEELHLDGLRLLRQAPAILDLRRTNAEGRELLALSRSDRDRIGAGTDLSSDPIVQAALAQGNFRSGVEFRRGSEPYLLLGKRVTETKGGVVLATVNLTFIKELVSQMKVGVEGRAYVVDRSGRLIAHPDLRFVLRGTNLLPLLQAYPRPDDEGAMLPGNSLSTRDIEGRAVLSVVAPVPNLDWSVIVDLPQSEAYAPIYASILRSLIILAGALLVTVITSILLSGRLVAPVRALTEGAARIGEGQLDERIDIRTGDELQELGDQFNLMAERLQESRSILEDKVSQRTAALAKALDQASAGQRAAEQARELAEEATKAKSRFLAVVGHDIRTPLSGVLGVLEILDRKRMSQRDRRLVEMAATSGETLIDLANATLDLSRLEAGTESLEKRDYEPGPLLAAAIALMRPAAERKGLTLRLDIEPVAMARLNGDPGKINRIVQNLLRNAISFTDAGEIEIAAALEPADDASGPMLVLAVHDTGIGIDPAMQRRIFQDFVQVDPETGRRSGGVGLGLAICTKLANLMGGSISVLSEVGVGSTFSVRLPAAAATSVAHSLHAETAETPLVVLVVDDEPVTREVARIMIAKAGHRVLTASSGEAALPLLASKRVDFVLLDMHMTGMDGIETAAAIRAIPEIACPTIVALTADVSPETMRRLLAAGLTTIVPKPATSAALRQVLTRNARGPGRLANASLSPDHPVDEAFLDEQALLVGAERMGRLVALFQTVSGDILEQLGRAIEQGDRKALERAAHQFASSASALGLGQAVTIASTVEAGARIASLQVMAQAVAELAQARDEALAALALRGAAGTNGVSEDQALRSAKMPSL
jgi:signal transduction histidine kinase/CheY-like chemotaxis protein